MTKTRGIGVLVALTALLLAVSARADLEDQIASYTAENAEGYLEPLADAFILHKQLTVRPGNRQFSFNIVLDGLQPVHKTVAGERHCPAAFSGPCSTPYTVHITLRISRQIKINYHT